jgi:general secretion pathway protein N
MSRLWIVVLGAAAVLAIIAFFPLRLALGLSDLGSIGFTARQVEGSIWSGRIGELHMRSQSLGTVDVALDPLALLIGTISMRFSRLGSPEGPLEGRLLAGFTRGLIDTSGRIAVGDMFAPLPIAALDLDQVTIRFRDGRCEQASGTLRPIIAAPVPGLTFDTGLAGTVQCDGARARVRMVTPSGAERLEFYVRDSGQYRAWMSIRNSQPYVAGALASFGFRPSPQGMTLTVDGRL